MQAAQKFDLNLEGHAEDTIDRINALDLPSILTEAQKRLEKQGYTVFRSSHQKYGLPISMIIVGGSSKAPKDDFFSSARELVFVYDAKEEYKADR